MFGPKSEFSDIAGDNCNVWVHYWPYYNRNFNNAKKLNLQSLEISSSSDNNNVLCFKKKKHCGYCIEKKIDANKVWSTSNGDLMYLSDQVKTFENAKRFCKDLTMKLFLVKNGQTRNWYISGYEKIVDSKLNREVFNEVKKRLRHDCEYKGIFDCPKM